MTTTAVSTRAASKLALAHVLDNVIQRPRISNTFKKGGYEKITDLLQLDDATISNLEYDTMVNNTTTSYPLQKGDMGMIRSFIHYIHHCSSIYNPIGNDWLSVADEMLAEFRTDLAQIYNLTLSTLYILHHQQLQHPHYQQQQPHHLYRLNLQLIYSNAVLSVTSMPFLP
jgi:hypothetical protein